MSPLIESIACKNGKLQNLEWHNARLNNSRRSLFKSKNHLFLQEVHIPQFVEKGSWKCRVVYSDIINGISFEPYKPKEVKSLTMVESTIDYSHKYSNRDELDLLFNKKQDADDILIIKDGFVTDSSIANILFYDDLNWVTPDTPLLLGTMRTKLIYTGAVKVKSITPADLSSYKKWMLINALNPFNEKRAVPLSSSILNL